jgi:phospholipid/cholesterol/gamma-HCH transport system substrate-binding protein
VAPEDQSVNVSRRAWISRTAAGAALLVGFVLVLVILFGGTSGRTYHLMFQNGGQLVPGNQVLVAGQPIGSVDSILLTDDSSAEVTISVDEPLHDGTTAVVRATSLSGIANRYVSITPGPNNAPTLADGATLAGDNTTSIVDLDQLFDTLRPPTRKAIKNVIKGQETLYAGHTEGARRSYKYFQPGLATTRRLLDELTRDQKTFTEFLVTGSKALGAIADRHDDLAALTQNANQALGAIAQENQSLDRVLVALPPALRQANTTFVNLRATLDDLTPLVNEAKPATKHLTPFLRQLRLVSERSVPVVKDLSLALNRPGNNNDLTESLRLQPRAERAAHRAVPNAIQALNDSQPVISFARPYAPDLFAWISKFDQDASYYDGDGHYVRVSTAEANPFHYCRTADTNPVCVGHQPGDLEPIPQSQQFNDLQFGTFTRCPGGAIQPILGSNPFLDGGNLEGKCDPNDVPPGP